MTENEFATVRCRAVRRAKYIPATMILLGVMAIGAWAAQGTGACPNAFLPSALPRSTKDWAA